MTKTIQTAILAALLLATTAQAAPGILMSDRAAPAPAESTGILIVGKAAPVDRAGLMLSDRAGLLISDRSAPTPAPADARAGILMSD